MKITPLEIRQKEFNKGFRGYDKDEVNAFLQNLSAEWERVNSDFQDTLKKLEEAQKEVAKLREVENSLFKTLKTAEDTGANMVEQSKKAAELHLKESEMKAEAILNDANIKARNIIEEAEDVASSTFQSLVDELKEIEENARQIEKLREDFVSDIKSSASEIVLKMDKLESKFGSEKALVDKIKDVKKEFKGKKAVKDFVKQEIPTPVKTVVEDKKPENEPKAESVIENKEAKTEVIEETKPEQKEEPKKEEAKNEDKDEKKTGSFFDTID